MTITLNRSYFMFMDMNNKGIAVDEDGSYVQYLFEDDKGFFNILNNVVAEWIGDFERIFLVKL